MSSYKCCTNPNLADDINSLAAKLKIISEPNRLSILCILQSNEHCVCELAEQITGISQSLLSHHLADLRAAGLIAGEKRGLRVYYSLTEAGRSLITSVLSLSKEGVKS